MQGAPFITLCHIQMSVGANGSGDLVSRAVDLIKSNIQHSSVLVQTSALSALVELSRFMALPLVDGEFPDDDGEQCGCMKS